MSNMRDVAANIVATIIGDLTGRKGLGDEWDVIDEDLQNEIREKWRESIETILRRYKP